jgi:hypothetical protein
MKEFLYVVKQITESAFKHKYKHVLEFKSSSVTRKERPRKAPTTPHPRYRVLFSLLLCLIFNRLFESSRFQKQTD